MNPLARAARNAGSGLSSRAVSMLVWIVITPAILVSLGASRYGEWALLSTIPMYFSLFDMGSTAFVRSAATMLMARDHDRINRTMWSGVAALGVIASVGFGALILGGPSVMALVGTPQADLQSVTSALVLLGGGGAISFALAPVSGLLSAAHRQDVINLTSLCTGVIGAAGSLLVLHLGWGLVGLAGITSTTTLFTQGLTLVAARYLVPGASMAPRRPEVGLILPTMRYALVLNAGSVAGAVNLYLDRWIVAGIKGLVAVTAYDLGWRLAMATRSLIQAPFPAMLPLVTHYVIRHQRERLASILDVGTSAVAAFGCLSIITAAIFATPLSQAWLGLSTPTVVGPIFVALLIGYSINNCTVVMSQITVADGRPGLLAVSSTLIVIMHLIASPILTILYGPLGAAWGATITLTAGSSLLTILFHRRYRFVTPISKRLPLLLLPPTLGAAVAGLIIKTLMNPTTRGGAALEFLVGGLAIVIAFAMVVLAIPASRETLRSARAVYTERSRVGAARTMEA